MKKKIKGAVMEHVLVDQDLQIAEVFGVQFSPVYEDPSREWLVLPDEVASNNIAKANKLYQDGDFESVEDFVEFSNTLISVVRINGEIDDVVDRFEDHLTKIVSGVDHDKDKHNIH